MTARRTHGSAGEALAEAAVERRTVSIGRVLAGLSFTALAVIITVLLAVLHTEAAALPVTYLSVLLWMIAVALLGPVLSRGAVKLLGGPLRAFPVGGFLAAQNSRANSRRMASAVTPLALLIGMTATILFVPAMLNDAARAETSAGIKVDYVVESSGAGFRATAAQTLRAVPGVSAVVEELKTTIWVGEDEDSAQGLTPAGLTEVLDPATMSGSVGQLGPDTIAISEADAQGRHIGDTVQVTLGDGTKTQLRLVAVYTSGLGFGDTLLDLDDVVGHVDNPLAQTVLIKGSATPAQLRARIEGFPGLTVTGPSGYGAAQAAQQRNSTEASLILMAQLIAFTAIAVISTLAMSINGRSR